MSDVEFVELTPEPVNETPSRGVLVFYLNVGQLPPYKAEAFLERAKDQYMKAFEHGGGSAPLPKDITILFIPVRPPDETFVDYIPFDGVTKDALEELRAVRDTLREFFNEHIPFAEEVDDREELVVDSRCCSGQSGCCDTQPQTWWGRVKGWFGRA